MPREKIIVQTDGPVPKNDSYGYRKILYPILFLLLITQWLCVLAQNLCEAFANSFEEIVLHLREYINPNAETKPPVT